MISRRFNDQGCRLSAYLSLNEKDGPYDSAIVEHWIFGHINSGPKKPAFSQRKYRGAGP